MELQAIQFGPEPMELFVFNSEQCILVENGNKGSMVDPNFEQLQWQIIDESGTFLFSPADCEQLEFDH
jgi:hypothetical protein